MRDRPVPRSNRLLHRLLGGYLEQVKAAKGTSMIDRVDSFIRGSLASGPCSIERCAEKLGLSVRTLQAGAAEGVGAAAAAGGRVAVGVGTGTGARPGRGGAVREVPQHAGYADYLLFVDGKALGVIEVASRDDMSRHQQRAGEQATAQRTLSLGLASEQVLAEV